MLFGADKEWIRADNIFVIIRDKGGIREGNPFMVVVINIFNIFMNSHINVSQLCVALKKGVVFFVQRGNIDYDVKFSPQFSLKDLVHHTGVYK